MRIQSINEFPVGGSSFDAAIQKDNATKRNKEATSKMKPSIWDGTANEPGGAGMAPPPPGASAACRICGCCGRPARARAARGRTDDARRPRGLMALSGQTFALSVAGESQAKLAAAIRRLGGAVSNTVHKRVDFLVVTEEALRKGTQAVRKVQSKFTGVEMVLPDFVRCVEREGTMCDPADYAPEASAAPQSLSRESARRFVPIDEVGLPEHGGAIEVLVEMSDDPPLVWWPATVVSTANSAAESTYPLTYRPLPARGYDEETPSRARFGSLAGGAEGGALPADADGRLYDLEEGVWRPWRHGAALRANGSREVASSHKVGDTEAGATVGSGPRRHEPDMDIDIGMEQVEMSQQAPADDEDEQTRRSASLRALGMLVFKRMSACQMFGRMTSRAAQRRRLVFVRRCLRSSARRC